MRSVAYPLQRAEREALAGYLGESVKEAIPPPGAVCSNRSFSWTPAQVENLKLQAVVV